MSKNLVSTDGLAVHDLSTMDMDDFREWLWPGVIGHSFIVWVTADLLGTYAVTYPVEDDLPADIVKPSSSVWWEYMVTAKSYSKDGAKRKAIAMVRDYLAKRHGPCAMTTRGNHGQET